MNEDEKVVALCLVSKMDETDEDVWILAVAETDGTILSQRELPIEIVSQFRTLKTLSVTVDGEDHEFSLKGFRDRFYTMGTTVVLFGREHMLPEDMLQ